MSSESENDSSFSKILERGLDLLANRAHSIYELRTKLLKKFDPDNDRVKEVIDYLKEDGFLNDDAFSINFIISLLIKLKEEIY